MMATIQHHQAHLGVDDATIHPVLRPQQLARHSDVNGGLLLVARDDPHHHAAPHHLLDRVSHAGLQLVLDGRASD